MKVTGASGVNTPSGSRAGGRVAGGFSVSQSASAGEAAQVGPTASVTGVNSIDALLALQSVGGPLERRRRALGRAGRMLDVLDDVKVALLDGEVSPNALDRLMVAIREEREDTEDVKLEGVLDEIEMRAAVEMAKLEGARRAA
jgi:hypothetical protein